MSQLGLTHFQKRHEFLVGIDSDGCAFDSMEIKHKECFIPNFIKYMGLQAISKYAREACEFTNLYSKTRGANRFPAYLLASRVSGSRWAGLAAAILTGLVTTFPSYYLSWGRYPHLAGLLVLPAAYVSVRAVLDRSRPDPRLVGAAAVLAAGQVLTHPRIALLLAALIAAEALTRVWGLRHDSRRIVQVALGLTAVAGVAAAMLLPWLARLSSSRIAGVLGKPAESTIGSFQVGLLTIGADRYVLAAAIMGVAVGVARRRRESMILPLWVALALAIANPSALGLPINPMLGNDALAISLWLPIAVGAGMLVETLGAWMRVSRWPVIARVATVGAVSVAAFLGAERIVPVANPACALATKDDVLALAWLRDHTGSDAFVLANARLWQMPMYAGTEGGYWVVPLAGRRSTIPPLVYDHARPSDTERIRRDGAYIEATQARRPGDLHRFAVERGLTHVYVGALGGPITSAELEAQDGFRLLYDTGRARVYAVER
mgnify:CR=1 FL=1